MGVRRQGKSLSGTQGTLKRLGSACGSPGKTGPQDVSSLQSLCLAGFWPLLGPLQWQRAPLFSVTAPTPHSWQLLFRTALTELDLASPLAPPEILVPGTPQIMVPTPHNKPFDIWGEGRPVQEARVALVLTCVNTLFVSWQWRAGSRRTNPNSCPSGWWITDCYPFLQAVQPVPGTWTGKHSKAGRLCAEQTAGAWVPPPLLQTKPASFPLLLSVSAPPLLVSLF